MICIRPPALSEATLLAWIDGYALPEVNTHLEQCLYCRTQAERLVAWQKQLATQLYRVDCPPTLELGEYHLGLLGSERLLMVEDHLTRCLHCVRETTDVTKLFEAPNTKPDTGCAACSSTVDQGLDRDVGRCIVWCGV